MASKIHNRHTEAERLFVEGDRLDDLRKYNKAIVPLLASARLGHAWSQLKVGNYYANGTGVRRRFTEAAYWYKKAYKNNSPPGASDGAAFNLAMELKARGNI